MLCLKCKGRMISKYSRENDGYTIRTRKCKNCGNTMHTIEMSKDEYTKSVEALNKIIEFLREEN